MCFVYGIILVKCVLYVRDVNVAELPLRLIKEIRNWKNQTLLAIGFAEAFAAKDAFQKAAASGGHIRTKIVTLKDQLAVGQPVQPAHLAESK